MSVGSNLNLEYLRKSAKRLLRSLKDAQTESFSEIAQHHPKHSGKTPAELIDEDFSLHDAQLVVARQKGFSSWPAMIAFVGDDDTENSLSQGLSADELRRFTEDGYVRLPGVVDLGDAVKMERFIWNCLAEHRGIRESDKSTWSTPGPWVGLKKFKRESLFASIYRGRFRAICDQLFGPNNWKRPTSSGGFLVTFPDSAREQWHVPSKKWHVDAHYTFDPDQLFGIRVFTYIADVLPRSGGTLVVRGSHRLVKQLVAKRAGYKQLKDYGTMSDVFKKSHPWLSELCEETNNGTSSVSAPDRIRYFMEQSHEVDGITVQVEELSAKQGDMIMAHPWIWHSAAPHGGERPRFVISKDVYSLDAEL